MRLLLSALGLATVASVVWLLLHAEHIDVVRTESAPAAARQPAAVETPAESSSTPQTPASAGDAHSGGPVPQPFREQLRRFLADSENLEPGERARRAAALERVVLAREAAGDLVPAESAYLQLSLLRASVTDEEDLSRRSAALIERYREASEAGWRAYREQSDPRHEAYRAAEADLVRAARAGDLPEAELRAQLQALRERYYADPN
ncbi:MAG: hypothetical protein RIC56_20250 [Pseudomonadales bacterium]